MPGTANELPYAAAGNPRTSHSATALTNKRVSRASRKVANGCYWPEADACRL